MGEFDDDWDDCGEDPDRDGAADTRGKRDIPSPRDEPIGGPGGD